MDESNEWDWEDMPKTTLLRKKVIGYFADNHISPKAPWWMLAHYMFWVMVLITQSYTWLMYGGWLPSVLFGLSIWLASGDLLHSGTHFAVLPNAKLNSWIGYTLGCFHHVPAVWVRQHVLGHHVFPNVEGKDPDLYHFESITFFSQLLGWRLSESSRFVKVFESWRYNLGIVMTLTGLGPLLIESLEFVCFGTLLSLWVVPHKTRVSPLRRAMALVHWALVMGLLLLVGWRHGVLTAIAPFSIHGTIYYVFSQVSHTNNESHVPGDR
jgi:hypothetical protein